MSSLSQLDHPVKYHIAGYIFFPIKFYAMGQQSFSVFLEHGTTVLEGVQWLGSWRKLIG